MERIRIDRKRAKVKPRPDVLPLDARDPDIVRAKRLIPDRAEPARVRAA